MFRALAKHELHLKNRKNAGPIPVDKNVAVLPHACPAHI